MKLTKLLYTTSAFLMLTACSTLKANTYTDADGAIGGYDPVAYFTENKPTRGAPEYTYEHNDAVWRFSSAGNLAAFEENPDRYTPQYGGYCAYAMSKGFVVSSDPDAWTIRDDKLYLNYSLGVRKTWLKNTPDNIDKADVHWQQKVHQSAAD